MNVLLQVAEFNAKTIFAWIIYVGFFVGALAIVWHILRESEREAAASRDAEKADAPKPDPDQTKSD